MVLKEQEIKKITSFVKKEPRTIQDIAKYIQKAWMTADAYVTKIKDQTGLLQTKIFRKGTKGAVKIVYWNYGGAVEHDVVRKQLYDQIRLGRTKRDFDPLEIYQHIPENKKNAFFEVYTNPFTSTKQGLLQFLGQTKNELMCFSGNMSWLRMMEHNIPVLRAVEDLLKRGCNMRILSRVDFATLENLNIFSGLRKAYPGQIEVRHAQQPLRGFIVDGERVRLKEEKVQGMYKQGELSGNMRVFYEWSDPEWVYWVQQVFWNIYRTAPSEELRMKEIRKIF